MIKSTPALMCFPEDLQRDRSLFKPQTAVLANFEQLSTLKRLARRTPKEISFNFDFYRRVHGIAFSGFGELQNTEL